MYLNDQKLFTQEIKNGNKVWKLTNDEDARDICNEIEISINTNNKHTET